MLPEVRVARIVEAVARCRAGTLTCAQAALQLGMSERHFRRLRDRYEAEGTMGLADRRVGRASQRRAPVDEVSRVLELFETRYWDFRVKHFHEVLTREHGLARSYSWVKNTLQAAGKVTRAAKRSAHRKRRARRPQEGTMLFQDGSRFRWLPELDQAFDLIVTMDDTTGKLYSAFLVEEEGTASSLRGLLEVIANQGLFLGFRCVERGALSGWDCQEFRVRAMGWSSWVQAIWKRSSNRVASWALAMPHSLGGILHSRSARFKTR